MHFLNLGSERIKNWNYSLKSNHTHRTGHLIRVNSLLLLHGWAHGHWWAHGHLCRLHSSVLWCLAVWGHPSHRSCTRVPSWTLQENRPTLSDKLNKKHLFSTTCRGMWIYGIFCIFCYMYTRTYCTCNSELNFSKNYNHGTTKLEVSTFF